MWTVDKRAGDGLSDKSFGLWAVTSQIRCMNPWSHRPGKKIPILRFTLESWAQHMADPVKYASMPRGYAHSLTYSES